MKIESFNRANVTALHAEMLRRLQAVAVEYGVKIAYGRGNHFEKDGTTAKVTFELTVDNPAKLEGAARERFQLNALLLGLKPSDYGRSFTSPSGRVLTVVDLNLSSRRRPVVLRDPQGKQYAGQAEAVRKALEFTQLKGGPAVFALDDADEPNKP